MSAKRPWSWFRMSRRTTIAIGSAVVAVAAIVILPATANTMSTGTTLLCDGKPSETTVAEQSAAQTGAVQVGVRFSADATGTVGAIKFHKGPKTTGARTGILTDAHGHELATVAFTDQRTSEWQTAQLSKPIRIESGKAYVASYLTPGDTNTAERSSFDTSTAPGQLTAPPGGGAYWLGGGFPTTVHGKCNYFVSTDTSQSTDAGATLNASSPSPSATPSAKPTKKPSKDSAKKPSSSTAGALNLPRIPWEGGSAYWKKFPKANAAGWSNPSFFPIVAWFGNFSSNKEVQYDKSLGINTYAQMWAGTPYSLFADNGVFWIGDALNSSFNDKSANWVGDFLGDEVDGWAASPAAGRAELAKQVKSYGNDGRFKYTNFTQQVIGKFMSKADQKKYVNDYTDVVSLDQYYYTNSSCRQTPFVPSGYIVPVNKAHCESSSSYGKSVASLRKVDAENGKLQPIWQYVENFNGGPGSSRPAIYIQPGQLEGAVMDSIINEARGILYFNQSLSGSCQSGNIFRQSEVVPNFCADPQVAAVKAVDTKIHQLATVINTQSYKYSFGSGLDTMLKTSGGSAYVFAMINGSSNPGGRTFTLPAGVHGKSVQVQYENRSIPVSAKGTFTDTFAHEYSYHIYKISLK